MRSIMKYAKLVALCVGGGILVHPTDVRAQINVDPNEGYYTYQRSHAAQLVARFNQVNATLAEDPPLEKAVPLYKEARDIWVELKTTYVNLLPSATSADSLITLRANIAQADTVIAKATTYLETHVQPTPVAHCWPGEPHLTREELDRRYPESHKPEVQSTPLPSEVRETPASARTSIDVNERFTLNGCRAVVRAKQAKIAHKARQERAASLVDYMTKLEVFINNQPNNVSMPTWLQWLLDTQTELRDIYSKELPDTTDPEAREKLKSHTIQLEQSRNLTKAALSRLNGGGIAFPKDDPPEIPPSGDTSYDGYQQARITHL